MSTFGPNHQRVPASGMAVLPPSANLSRGEHKRRPRAVPDLPPESADDRAWDERVAREVRHQEVIEASFDRAEAYGRLGDFEHALQWLDRAAVASGGLPDGVPCAASTLGAGGRASSPAARPRLSYANALLDWLACASAGRNEPAALAARATGDSVVAAAAAGHVLDFDDTYLPGLAHLSAPTAPVALVLGAELSASVGDALAAYAAGFEAMGALAAASHPALYERGFHPTAVCGVVGAAVTAARLLGADERTACAVALLRAGGLRASFGSDGKALQVGMAAAEGLRAARLAASGASVPLERVARGFEDAYGAQFAEPGGSETSPVAMSENWIKAYPCCLQAHSSIEAADRARADGVPVDESLTRDGSPDLGCRRLLRDARRRPPGQVLDSVSRGVHPASRAAHGRELRRPRRRRGRRHRARGRAHGCKPARVGGPTRGRG